MNFFTLVSKQKNKRYKKNISLKINYYYSFKTQLEGNYGAKLESRVGLTRVNLRIKIIIIVLQPDSGVDLGEACVMSRVHVDPSQYKKKNSFYHNFKTLFRKSTREKIWVIYQESQHK